MTRLAIPLTLLGVTLVLAVAYALCVAAGPDRETGVQRVSVGCGPVVRIPASEWKWEDRV